MEETVGKELSTGLVVESEFSDNYWAKLLNGKSLNIYSIYCIITKQKSG